MEDKLAKNTGILSGPKVLGQNFFQLIKKDSRSILITVLYYLCPDIPGKWKGDIGWWTILLLYQQS